MQRTWISPGAPPWTRTHRAKSRVLTTVVLSLLLSACGSHLTRQPDIVLIVIDTLRADALGCHGNPAGTSPTLDALARRGVQFRRCISQSPWTLPSTATILSGRYPSAHGATMLDRRITPDVPLLAERLREQGYATAAVVSAILLRKGYGFVRGFDHYDETNAQGPDHVSSRHVTDRALRLLDSSPRPQFLFLHYFDPHYAFVEHRGITRGAAYDGPVESGMEIWALRALARSLGSDDRRHLLRLYEGEVRLVDTEVRRLIRRLEERGRLDETVVLVTADHGEEFLEHGWIGHTRSLYRPVLEVPLIAAGTGWTGPGIRDDPATHLDVFPSILRMAGGSAEGPGRDLTGDIPPRPLISEVSFDTRPLIGKTTTEERAAQELAVLRSVRKGRWKAIRNVLTGEWRLFDLRNDPAELDDRAAEQPEVLAELQEVLASWESRLELGTGDTIEIDEEDRERLRGLGYVK